MKHNAMAIDVRTRIIYQCAGDHNNHVQHGKGSYGTNKHIDSCEEHRSRPRRFGGRVRLEGRLPKP